MATPANVLASSVRPPNRGASDAGTSAGTATPAGAPNASALASSVSAAPAGQPPAAAQNPTATVTPLFRAPVPAASEGGEAGPIQTPATQDLAASRAALRRAVASDIGAWWDESMMWLRVPFRTQLDGTAFAPVNCGPASLSMVLAAFGVEVAPDVLRDYVNALSGDYSPDDGTSLHLLSSVAAEAGLQTMGASDRWTIPSVRDHVRLGHPVITLAKYRSLPGNGRSAVEFDHYVVITGSVGDDLIYNDAALPDNQGQNLLMSSADLERAWHNSSIPRHAAAFGLASGPVPVGFAPRLRARVIAVPPESGSDQPTPAPEPHPAAPAEAAVRGTDTRPDIASNEPAPGPSKPAPPSPPTSRSDVTSGDPRLAADRPPPNTAAVSVAAPAASDPAAPRPTVSIIVAPPGRAALPREAIAPAAAARDTSTRPTWSWSRAGTLALTLAFLALHTARRARLAGRRGAAAVHGAA
ncbi:MAG: C39 family peptidase [Chloroflexota bacterium]